MCLAYFFTFALSPTRVCFLLCHSGLSATGSGFTYVCFASVSHSFFEIYIHTYSNYIVLICHAYRHTTNNAVKLSSFTEIVISAIAVISNVTAEEERFTLPSFPPRICENKNNNLYNSILPESVVATMMTAMLIIVGWVIYKVNLSS